MLEKLNRVRYVYHYTSLETFFAIMENHRKGIGADLVFHASNIFKVNDPKEMEVGFDFLKMFLPQYEEKNGIPKQLRLSEVYLNVDTENECRDKYLLNLRNELNQNNNTIQVGIIPYVFSLSERRDYLPMWTLYGNKGKGICFKFDLNEIKEDTSMMVQMDFVAYNQKQSVKTMNEVVPFLYGLYLSKDCTTINSKITEVSDLCFSISPFFKYKDYSYEKEYRIVYYQDYGINLKNRRQYNSSNIYMRHPVKPYIDIPIPSCALKEIILGPCVNINIIKDVILRELTICGMNVRIARSNVPFRLKQN